MKTSQREAARRLLTRLVETGLTLKEAVNSIEALFPVQEQPDVRDVLTYAPGEQYAAGLAARRERFENPQGYLASLVESLDEFDAASPEQIAAAHPHIN